RAAWLDDVELFDAEFFGYTPREAELMDPQQRLFLETAWHALEHAGYDSESYNGTVGVFAGGKMGTYLFNLTSNPELFQSLDTVTLGLGNDIALLAMRTSYKLDLRGPSYFVQSACSTSLVAVHLACQSLLIDECQMALAGGVAIDVPNKRGYVYQDAGILSPDGCVRAFDAQAQGTVFGSGLGVVVLKRLEDAVADGDRIYAVIKGSATNNDGAVKANFTAPSVDGQAEVILRALVTAEVAPETISYVETHGTGTNLGDPVEIRALTKAYRAATEKRFECAIGSVKSNVGHLDAAAGISGLIKTVLALDRKLLPPSLHFERPNPKCGFEATPFRVNTEPAEWRSEGGPRRAGLSSFGFGGTNTHVVFEQAPPARESGESRPWQLLVLSARSESALEAAGDRLGKHLEENPDLNLADVAYTLKLGRRTFRHRRAVVGRNPQEAMRALKELDPQWVFTGFQKSAEKPVVFLFSGQGAQYVHMGRELYRTEATFREELDRCSEILRPHLGLDLRALLYPPEEEETAAALKLEQTAVAQPALFAVEYALAGLWREWGVRPQAMIGHSIGEYVAACLAGVFALEDALGLVAARGRLMQEMPAGAMLSVALPEERVETFLGEGLSLAAVNGPGRCVVSGPADAVDALARRLAEEGAQHRPLHTSHAFHSAMMDPILERFLDQVRNVRRSAPRIPFVSNVTGTRITDEMATDPRYWVEHLRRTVRFSEGLGELLREPERVLLEVGPGNALSTFAREHPQRDSEQTVLHSLPHPNDRRSDPAFLLTAVGRLWLAGVKIDGAGFYAHERRRRLPLPGYPFERRRFWIAKGEGAVAAAPAALKLGKKPDVGDWFYLPSWKRAADPGPFSAEPPSDRCWLVLTDEVGVGSRLAERLQQRGCDVMSVRTGERFGRNDDGQYTLNPSAREDYDSLFDELRSLDKSPGVIAHLWTLTPTPAGLSGAATFDRMQELGFQSLLFLAQAIGNHLSSEKVEIGVISDHLHEVSGGEVLSPEKATVLGPCKVIPQEFPNLTCRSIDVELPEPGNAHREELPDKLIAELLSPPDEPIVAYRGPFRWVRTFERRRLEPAAEPPARLRRGGVYLITGGMGGIGLVIAQYLARAVAGARLVLVGRSPLPERQEWEPWLESHDEQEATSRKIRKIRELEAIGAEVLPASADVADAEQMRRVVARTGERFGKIHGVIHAAGLAGGGLIQLKTPEEVARVFRPKALGLLNLEALFNDSDPDFLVLFSSISSVLGEFGQVDYCAANTFLDAFAERRRAAGDAFTVAINWDTWQEVGIAVSTEVPEEMRQLREEAIQLGISNLEGQDAFGRILAGSAGPQVIVCTRDLEAAIGQVKEFTRSRLLAADGLGQATGRKHPRPQLDTSYAAPANETEEAVAELWQEVLGLEQVGRNDNFFDLGGHSLLATQLMSRLRGALRVALPLERLFAAPTVAGLAEAVLAVRAEQTPSGTPELAAAAADERIPRRRGFADRAPLSFAQERMWFLQQLDTGTSAYNLLTPGRLRGPLDPGVLERSFHEVVRRHEVLRTTYAEEEGHPVQIIAPALRLELPLVDLGGLPEPVREAEMERLANLEQERCFDLTRGPLVRIVLVRLGAEDHAMFVVMHHIISDGWSTGVVIRELATLYEAFSAGRAPRLPELPIQYADFAVWQRDRLRGEVLEAYLDYWREHLGSDVPTLNLATDRPRASARGYKSGGRSELFPEDLAAGLRELGKREGVTLFMLLLAAFQALLYRYTGERDILVGTPIAGRNRNEIEGLIGFFLNTLVLRARPRGGTSFREFLAQVSESALGGFAHQDLPLETVLQALGRERTAPFQVMFLFQNVPPAELEFSNLSLNVLKAGNPVELETAIFDLCLIGEETPEGLLAAMAYNANLFDEDTIVRLFGHFRTLVASAVADPGRRLDQLPLYEEGERRQLLAWNDTRGEYPRDRSIHELFEAQAARTPEATAVLGARGELTYRDLNRRANQLAHHLRALGVGPEARVGLCLERSPEMVIGMLGVLKAGGAYVPIDPAYPAERTMLILEDIAAPVVATSERLAAELPEHGAEVVCLDSGWEVIARQSDENPASPAGPRNAAYLIYTSGSTGRPKGVLVEHRSLVNFTAAARARYPIGPDDRVLQFASISFDTSAEEIYPALTCGATVVLRTDSMLGSARALREECGAWGVTVLDLPTAYWHELTAGLEAEGLELGPPLRLVILGGERPLPDRLATFVRHLDRRVRLLNTYGPTEATVVATFCELPPWFPQEHPGREAPIGRPLPNVRAYVVDPRLELAPTGAPGELAIGGEGLARGYLDRPQRTAERFPPDPFGEEPGMRLYRTGDRVRRLAEGELEFLGRLDFQVKVRGFRIELGEIEAALSEHPAVREVAVLARVDGAGESTLAAYLVAREESPSISDLRAFLEARLPEYMVPSAFVALDSLPLTPSGKLDRRALPAPDRERPELEESYLAPRNEVEEFLCEVFAQILDIERVGAYDSFFDLGGHSLLLPQILFQVRDAFEVEVPVRTLYDEPTVAGLAEVIEELILDQLDELDEAL
ncbi:MAG: amino acid adenylation domain-containing protein, partial [bacterium]|nr:amino acid adenylation domain-containing protein [bacterium]